MCTTAILTNNFLGNQMIHKKKSHIDTKQLFHTS